MVQPGIINIQQKRISRAENFRTNIFHDRVEKGTIRFCFAERRIYFIDSYKEHQIILRLCDSYLTLKDGKFFLLEIPGNYFVEEV